jgi:hypothetical protein
METKYVRGRDCPVARTIADLVTPKQLILIRSLGKRAQVDAEKLGLGKYGCRPEELTKGAADHMINYLIECAKTREAHDASEG